MEGFVIILSIGNRGLGDNGKSDFLDITRETTRCIGQLSIQLG